MFVKIIYRHFVFNQEKYQVCKFRIYRHFVKSVNGSNFPVILARLRHITGFLIGCFLMRTMGRTVEPKFLDGFKNMKAAYQQMKMRSSELY